MSMTADSGSITTGMRLGVLGTALVLLTGTSCYRKAIDGWHLVDATAPVMGVTSDPIAGDGMLAESTDVRYVNGYTVSAVVQSTANFTTGSIIAVAKDSTGATVVKSTLQSGLGVADVKIVVSGTRAVVFWRAGTTLRASRFDSAAPSAFGAPVDVTTNASDETPAYDAQMVPSAGNIAVCWNAIGTLQLQQLLLTPSTMAVSATTTYAAITDSSRLGYLTNTYSDNTIYLGSVSVSGLRVTTFLGSTIGALGSTIYDATITAALNVAGYRDGASVSVYVSIQGSNAYDHQIRLSTGGAASVVRRSVSLASRVLSANSTLYALVRYENGASFTFPYQTIDGSFFLVDLLTQKEIAKVFQDVAGSGTAIATMLPSLSVGASASLWLTAATRVTSVSTDNSSIVPYTSAHVVALTYQDATVGRPVELNGVLFIPGAMPYIYDGTTITEAGFPIGPEPSATATPAAGGSMSPGHSYAYSHVLAWTDATGGIHRSTQTEEFNVTLGAADTQVTHSIPTLRITRKAGVVIETYRRNLTANEVILRRVSSATAPTVNDPTADRVTFVDQISDTTAASGEPIYTNGDPSVLENIAPPPCRTMAVHRGRLLVGGIAGDPAAIWFSKDVIPGFGVAFSDALVSRLSTAEAITALGSVDSYAVACTGVGSGSTWASSNDYPDDTGGGGVLRFEHMSGSVGCSSPMLMARTDDGLHVWAGTKGSTQSGLKGPYLITRGISFEQVGAPAEDDADILTPAAVLAVPTRNQVRFLGSSSDVAAAVGVALVRESFFKTWARWDYARHSAAIVDAAVWQGTAVYLATDGTVYTETLTDTVIDDLGFAVPHSLDIAAFNFGGVAGYSRIRLGQLVGTVKGAAAVFTLSVVQTADGVAMAAKTRVITGQADGSALDVEFDPGTGGKCSAYALRISDSGNSANAAWTLAAITMEVGTKPGLSRLPAARRMT